MRRNHNILLKSVFSILLFLLLISIFSIAFAFGPAEQMQGDGTTENPYIVTTPNEFNSIRDNLSACYKLGADIDLAGFSSWAPIGSYTGESDYSQAFSGDLDGNGYVISNLCIADDLPNSGLFGYSYKAKFKNVILKDVDISLSSNSGGQLYGCITGCLNGGEIDNSGVASGSVVFSPSMNGSAGGIAGEIINDGCISGCYNACFIQSTGQNTAGGIAGTIQNGTIENCYNVGAVFSQEFAGGITGYLIFGTIDKCYNVANVAYKDNGAIVGVKVMGAVIQDCFFLNNRPTANADGTDKTSLSLTPSQLTQAASYVNYDFGDLWVVDESSGYPYAQLKNNRMLVPKQNTTEFSGGCGLDYSPYLVSTADQLNNVRKYFGSYYKLANDLDLSQSTTQGGAFYHNGSGWEPIGSFYIPFFGDFNGNGNEISGMHISRAGDYGGDGLFGRVKGSVENLGIKGGNIYGGYFTGAIAGYLSGNATNCRNTSDVSASMGSNGSVYLGGLFGAADQGVLENCYNSGKINASVYGEYEGGIVGTNSSDILQCYDIGDVSGSGHSGGITGEALGNISKCYNTGDIDGHEAGGICGSMWKKQVLAGDCFNAGNVRGSYAGGIVGYLFEGSVAKSYNSGNVSHCAWSGSIVGYEMDGCSVANCFYLDGGENSVGFSDASEGSNTDLAALTMAQMEAQANFASFDFTGIWEFGGGQYPFPTLIGLTMISPPEDPTDFAGGAGTVYSPYIVENERQFDNIRMYPGADYSITRDIDLSALVAAGGKDYNDGAGWLPIGSDSTGKKVVPFFGVLSGNGHVVTGIVINRKDFKFVGLFAEITGKVSDFSLMDGTITGGMMTGGICGYNFGEIKDCYNTCDIIDYTFSPSDGACAGGIAGSSGNQLYYCYNTGDVTTFDEYHCMAYSYIGGITGSAGGKLEYCYNCGEIGNSSSGHCVIGGISGYGYGGVIPLVIDNCYNSGTIDAQCGYSWIAGGIVGEFDFGTMNSCYNIGDIQIIGDTTPKPGCGAIVCTNDGTIDNCYYLDNFPTGIQYGGTSDPSNNVEVTNVIQETSDHMKLQSTYIGFDFDTVWSIDPAVHSGYPHLKFFDDVANNVHFDSTGGSAVANTTSSGYTTILPPANPTRIGYLFAGWYKEPECVNSWNFNSDLVEHSITLFAKWTSTTVYTVSFNSEGGSPVTSVKVNKGATIPKPTDPTRTGYTFGGWFKESSCKNAWNFDTNKVTKNVTLYAKWVVDAAVTGVQATPQTYNSILITWTVFPGVAGYEVSRSTSQSSGFKVLGTTTSASFKDKNAVTGTPYYYRVRAYVKYGSTKYYGHYSDVSTPVHTTLSKPMSVSAKRLNATSIKVNWAKVAGATKYEIREYIGSASGTYKSFFSTSTSFTDKKLTTGTPYYYVVIAYRKVGSQWVTSDASDPANATP